MTQTRTIQRCGECGAVSAKWVGRCAACGAWGSLATELVVSGGGADGRLGMGRRVGASGSAAVPSPLVSVDAGPSATCPTGVAELDLVLGGGLVPGSVTLLGGEPGIGKSTLLLQVLVSMAAGGSPCLLVCAEESAAQVRLRSERLGAPPAELLVLAESSLPLILDAVDRCRPAVCVIDSIQAVADAELPSAPGSVTQVRECAQALTVIAKQTGTSVVLVGHVTKDGGLAGPRTLEHIVDTVLEFEGDRHHALRLLRATKHRFGATGELGLFEMTDAGLGRLADPSQFLLGDRRRDVPGSAVVSAMEGRRPMLIEIQAVLGKAYTGSPRRSPVGIDSGRLALLLAVLDRHSEFRSVDVDVFVSAVGGVKMTEPAADLGIALALMSATTSLPLPDDLVVFGEVGLTGELRAVPHSARRLAEARRMGFTRAMVPASTPPGPDGLQVVRVGTLSGAIAEVPNFRWPDGGIDAAWATSGP